MRKNNIGGVFPTYVKKWKKIHKECLLKKLVWNKNLPMPLLDVSGDRGSKTSKQVLAPRCLIRTCLIIAANQVSRTVARKNLRASWQFLRHACLEQPSDARVQKKFPLNVLQWGLVWQSPSTGIPQKLRKFPGHAIYCAAPKGPGSQWLHLSNQIYIHRANDEIVMDLRLNLLNVVLFIVCICRVSPFFPTDEIFRHITLDTADTVLSGYRFPLLSCNSVWKQSTCMYWYTIFVLHMRIWHHQNSDTIQQPYFVIYSFRFLWWQYQFFCILILFFSTISRIVAVHIFFQTTFLFNIASRWRFFSKTVSVTISHHFFSFFHGIFFSSVIFWWEKNWSSSKRGLIT